MAMNPTPLDVLIDETVPRKTLRDSLVMFLAGLAELMKDQRAVENGTLSAELEAKKGTIADALVANTPVAPAGLGAGPGAVAPEFQVKQDVEPAAGTSGLFADNISTQGATGSGSASNALFPHEVAVGDTGSGIIGSPPKGPREDVFPTSGPGSFEEAQAAQTAKDNSRIIDERIVADHAQRDKDAAALAADEEKLATDSKL